MSGFAHRFELAPRVRALGSPAMVRSDSLRYFADLVSSMGHDPHPLFHSARIDPAVVRQSDQLVPYRQMVFLLECTAEKLGCHDFGLQLAQRQYSEGILGELDIAMRNSPTVGEAWRFCSEHVHMYSTATSVSLATCEDTRRKIIRFEIVLPQIYRQQQAVEHALLISHLATRMFSGGRAGAREVWFSHEPVGQPATHAEYFGCKVRFAQSCNALFLNESDFLAPVEGRDERVLKLATYFIDTQFPACDTMIKTKVRIAIEQQLSEGKGTQAEVASALGMHPRTLQRRLKDEGENFEAIKDEIRRDAAVRYLRQTSLPLKTVASLLGYSELSVLYRSCHRWFGQSPSVIREISDISELVLS